MSLMTLLPLLLLLIEQAGADFFFGDYVYAIRTYCYLLLSARSFWHSYEKMMMVLSKCLGRLSLTWEVIRFDAIQRTFTVRKQHLSFLGMEVIVLCDSAHP